MRHRSASARLAIARAALVCVAALALVACAAAPPPPTVTPVPSAVATQQPRSIVAPSPTATTQASTDIPDEPTTTNAVAIARPQRGSSAPVGAVVFGADVAEGARNVNVSGERTMFAQGREVAWRVTLPTAVGGESVRVTLTTEDNTETLVDEFVAQAGWNVYYGKSLLSDTPGTYVLHYLVDGHEQGSGTFKIKPPDADVAVPSMPTGMPSLQPTPTSS